MNKKEHREQSALIAWARNELVLQKYPELALLHAIPNGGSRPTKKVVKNGKTYNYCPEGKRLKREGLLAGVPDLHLPVARYCYHSLYIEMKVGSAKPTKKQREVMDLLRKYGNKTVVCRSAMQAIEVITEYLDAPRD